MYYLIDYENVNVDGLEGINCLTSDDAVEIYYSDKSDRMDMSMVDMLRRVDCHISMTKSEKTAPNYMDIQIICKTAVLLSDGMDNVTIISKDKGYISAKDFFAKPAYNKKITLAESILNALSNESDITKTAKYEEPTNDLVGIINQTISEAANNKKKVNRVSQVKKLSASDKSALREMLKDLPKHNGKLQQSVIDCFSECNSLGQVHYKLVADVGRIDGEKAYKIIEKKFAEFKNLEVTKTGA